MRVLSFKDQTPTLQNCARIRRCIFAPLMWKNCISGGKDKCRSDCGTAATIHEHSKEGVRIRHHGAIASEMGPKLKPFFSGQSFRSCKRHIHWHNRVYYPPSPMAKQHTMPTTEAAAATTMLHSDETEKFWRRRPTFCFSFKNVLP